MVHFHLKYKIIFWEIVELLACNLTDLTVRGGKEEKNASYFPLVVSKLDW